MPQYKYTNSAHKFKSKTVSSQNKSLPKYYSLQTKRVLSAAWFCQLDRLQLRMEKSVKDDGKNRNQAEVARKHLVVASGSVCSERVYLTRSDICQFLFFLVQETSEKCLWNKRSPLCSRVAWSVTHSFTITSPLNVQQSLNICCMSLWNK